MAVDRSKSLRYNKEIKVPFVVRHPKFSKFYETRLLDQDLLFHNIVKTEDAKRIADQAGLDLVCFAMKTRDELPLCKILNFGKWKYEESKKHKKQQHDNKKKATKEIRFSPLISEHDVEHKIRQANDFLRHGHDVILSMQLKGRQKQFFKSAEERMNTFLEMCNECEEHSVRTKKTSNNISIRITPQKVGHHKK